MFAEQTAKNSDTRLLLVPPAGTRADIDGASTLTQLRARFRNQNVTADKISVGEGEMVDGTVLFASDPARRLEIAWKDTRGRARPEFVRFNGERSRWTVGAGITLGTSLREIESLNGRPFILTGFDYDYAGTIVDWQNGLLAPLQNGPRIFVRLQPERGADVSKAADHSELMGGRLFNSDLAAMQRLNPRVYEIVVRYRDCREVDGVLAAPDR
jgi:hypothetical protein